MSSSIKKSCFHLHDCIDCHYSIITSTGYMQRLSAVQLYLIQDGWFPMLPCPKTIDRLHLWHFFNSSKYYYPLQDSNDLHYNVITSTGYMQHFLHVQLYLLQDGCFSSASSPHSFSLITLMRKLPHFKKVVSITRTALASILVLLLLLGTWGRFQLYNSIKIKNRGNQCVLAPQRLRDYSNNKFS